MSIHDTSPERNPIEPTPDHPGPRPERANRALRPHRSSTSCIGQEHRTAPESGRRQPDRSHPPALASASSPLAMGRLPPRVHGGFTGSAIRWGKGGLQWAPSTRSRLARSGTKALGTVALPGRSVGAGCGIECRCGRADFARSEPRRHSACTDPGPSGVGAIAPRTLAGVGLLCSRAWRPLLDSWLSHTRGHVDHG